MIASSSAACDLTTIVYTPIGGSIGRLPNGVARKRMAAFIDALPPAPPPGPQGIQKIPLERK
jgi:hypothetical protein